MNKPAPRNGSSRRRALFVPRELIVRTDGNTRTIRITARLQALGLALGAAAACAAVAGLGALAHDRFQNRAVAAALAAREAQVMHDQQQVAAYRDEVRATTDRLEQRQAFLERMVDMLPATDTAATETAAGASPQDAAAGEDDNAATLRRISAVLPEARGFAGVERRQLAAAAILTGYAENRAARAERGLRRLGLDPQRVMAATQAMLVGAEQSGRGGPLELLASEADGSLDPRFARLGASFARLASLEQGLAHVPQVMPTDLARMTSGFGYRRDPFTGAAAMHAGLDFGGRMGDPIRAAADGAISFVGTKGGYGRVVEITHGNGLMTRYAHMSAFKARPGQRVAAGEVIGAIGSSGRSTGPHLHFEVRVGDRAINPRPFLESAPDILAELRAKP